jgi:hypothetical protein
VRRLAERNVEKYRKLLKPPAVVTAAAVDPHDDLSAERREPSAGSSANEITHAEATSRKQGVTNRLIRIGAFQLASVCPNQGETITKRHKSIQ